MPPPPATADLYSTLQRYQLLLVLGGRRLWSQMSPTDFDRSWSGIAPSLEALTSGAQLAAATAGAAYVPTVLAETGQLDAPEARVRPQAFAGVASDGRTLAGLLEGSVVAAKRAVTRGMSPDQALLGGQQWLETALRGAVSDAARDATSASIVARPHMGWTRMVNPPCCSRCAVLAGAFYRWNTGFQRHPRCFPAGVVVSGPGHEAATRRWYQGELVVLATASGQELSLTGNHPVLTSRGWIPANLLNEGDEVVRSTLSEGAHSLVVPDHHEVPSRIEDVWGALSVAGLDSVESSPEDFHGDGQKGQVDVVRANGPLDLSEHALTAEHLFQGSLAIGLLSPESLHGECSAIPLNLGLSPKPYRAMCCSGLSLALTGGHLRGAESPGFTRAAPRYSSGGKAFGQDAAGDSVLARQAILAGPGLVGADDLGHRQVQSPLWDAPGLAFSVETREGYASRGLDLLDRLAGQIELDRVVKLRRVEWSGHVYSLTSVEGWHSANSLIVSNCDCLHIPTQENRSGDFTTDPQELVKRGLVHDLTSAQKARIDDGHDLVKVLNESRDRWRERMAADRRAQRALSKRQQWAGAEPGPARTVNDFMAHLTSRVDAINAMRGAGIVD